MKKIVTILLLSLLLVLGGCQSKSNSEKKWDEKAVVVEGVKIALTDISKAEDVSSKKNQTLYVFKVVGENVTPLKKGLGSSEFTLKTDDNEVIQNTGELASFGDEILPGKELKGNVYFWVSNDKKPKELVYQPTEEAGKTWRNQEN